MNKIYGLNIDMLRLCYEIKEPNNINILRTREIDEEVDFLYFYLRRIEGKHFKFKVYFFFFVIIFCFI